MTLKPSAALASRIAAVRDKVASMRVCLDKWDAAQDELQRATVSADYRKALEKMIRFVQAPEIIQARKMLVDFPDTDQLWTALFSPGDSAG